MPCFDYISESCIGQDGLLSRQPCRNSQIFGSCQETLCPMDKVGCPVLIALWYAWCMYELIKSDKSGGMVILVCATIGGIIGGLIGFSINRKVIRKTGEILEQIEELQKES